MMQSWFQKYRHALWFLLFGVLSAFYFVSQHLGLRYHCCFANKLRKIFIQSAKKKRRLKGF